MYYDVREAILNNTEYTFRIGYHGEGKDFEMEKRMKKQHYTFEFEMYELNMSYKFKSFSAFDSPIKALVVCLSYVHEIEEYYETKVNAVDIFDESGRREYTLLL